MHVLTGRGSRGTLRTVATAGRRAAALPRQLLDAGTGHAYVRHTATGGHVVGWAPTLGGLSDLALVVSGVSAGAGAALERLATRQLCAVCAGTAGPADLLDAALLS